MEPSYSRQTKYEQQKYISSITMCSELLVSDSEYVSFLFTVDLEQATYHNSSRAWS